MLPALLLFFFIKTTPFQENAMTYFSNPAFFLVKFIPYNTLFG